MTDEDRVAFRVPKTEKKQLFEFARARGLTVSELLRGVAQLVEINEKLGKVAKARGRVVDGLLGLVMEILGTLNPEDHDPRITAAFKKFGEVYKAWQVDQEADEVEGYEFGLN